MQSHLTARQFLMGPNPRYCVLHREDKILKSWESLRYLFTISTTTLYFPCLICTVHLRPIKYKLIAAVDILKPFNKIRASYYTLSRAAFHISLLPCGLFADSACSVILLADLICPFFLSK